MRRSARAYPAALLLAATACSHAGLSLARSRHPVNPALLLGCARDVSTQAGLSDVQLSDGRLEARSAVDLAPAQLRTPATYDVLTVTLAPARHGMRLIVGGASYMLRQIRGGGIGASAARTEWEATEPSEHVARARDTVLERCGTLGQ